MGSNLALLKARFAEQTLQNTVVDSRTGYTPVQATSAGSAFFVLVSSMTRLQYMFRLPVTLCARRRRLSVLVLSPLSSF